MIGSLRLQKFRSYTDESFEFEPGVNIIVGPNASGKTNLLEAILVIAQGSSYRVKDAELIKYDQPWARLDSTSSSETRTIKFQPQTTGTIKKDFVINDQNLKQLRKSFDARLSKDLFCFGSFRFVEDDPRLISHC